jgi:pyruvate/2-oxoglutarate/acetoin dehydrogenase E1 component
MKTMKYADAINEALKEEILRDDNVFVIGEAIGGEQGGTFKVTQGLQQELGKDKIIESAISEAALGGVAVGAAIYGMRPVVEIMFGSLLGLLADEIRNQAGSFHYVSGGKTSVPMVIRACNWMRIISGPHHCGHFDALFMNSPGIKAVAPATPNDAKGLLKAAIRDNDPVMFLEYFPLYAQKGEVEEGDYVIPIGKADIKREGSDVTVICYGVTVPDALQAAAVLEKQGISIEVLDLRTFVPYDKQAIRESVEKTSRVIVVYDGYKTGGVGAEISAFIAEECIEYLSAPIIRVASLDVPNPSNPVLMKEIIIGKDDVIKAVHQVLQ